ITAMTSGRMRKPPRSRRTKENRQALKHLRRPPSSRPSCARLHLHLSAELDHPARRNAEELGRRQRVAVHEVEHLPPEATEARVPAGHDRDPPDEKGCIHHVEV